MEATQIEIVVVLMLFLCSSTPVNIQIVQILDWSYKRLTLRWTNIAIENGNL